MKERKVVIIGLLGSVLDAGFHEDAGTNGGQQFHSADIRISPLPDLN